LYFDNNNFKRIAPDEYYSFTFLPYKRRISNLLVELESVKQTHQHFAMRSRLNVDTTPNT